MALTEEEQAHVAEAEGYLELGLFDEAAYELEEIETRYDPEVLTLKVAVYRRSEKWEAMQTSAKELVEVWPHKADTWIVWAFAARKAEGLEAGFTILKRGELLHPDSAIIQFTLGCYARQLGEPREAIQRMKRAAKIDPRLRDLALGDPELVALWGEN